MYEEKELFMQFPMLTDDTESFACFVREMWESDAAVWLKKLQLVVHALRPRVSGRFEAELLVLRHLVESFEEARLLTLAAQPEITALTAKIIRFIRQGDIPDADEVMLLLLGLLAMRMSESERISLLTSETLLGFATGNFVYDFAYARSIRSDRLPSENRTRLSARTGRRAGAFFDRVTLATFGNFRHVSESFEQVFFVDTGGRGVPVLAEHSWCAKRLEQLEVPELDFMLNEARAIRDFCGEIESALHSVRDAAVNAYNLVQECQSAYMPIVRKSNAPNNFSLPDFRGLIACTARPPLLGAQTLVHEASHNLFNAISRVVPLVHEGKTRVYSPFTRRQRPILIALNSIYAFENELFFTRSSIARSGTKNDRAIFSYFLDVASKTDELVRQINHHTSVLTPAGAALFSRIKAIAHDRREFSRRISACPCNDKTSEVRN